MPDKLLIVAVVGVVLYWLCAGGDSKSKLAHVGDVLFWTGLLAWLLAGGAK